MHPPFLVLPPFFLKAKKKEKRLSKSVVGGKHYASPAMCPGPGGFCLAPHPIFTQEGWYERCGPPAYLFMIMRCPIEVCGVG